jgi:hypothetical protein
MPTSFHILNACRTTSFSAAVVVQGCPLAGAAGEEHPLAVGFPIEEIIVQLGAVRPFVVEHPYQSRPTGRHVGI